MNDTEIPIDARAIIILYDAGIDTHAISRLLSENIRLVNKQIDKHLLDKKRLPNVKSSVERPGFIQIVPPTTNWSAIAFFLYGHSMAKCNQDERVKLKEMFPDMEKILKENYKGKNESNDTSSVD